MPKDGLVEMNAWKVRKEEVVMLQLQVHASLLEATPQMGNFDIMVN